MSPGRTRRAGMTLAELLVSLTLTTVILVAVAAAMSAAQFNHAYNYDKAQLVTRVRGVLDRIVHDIQHAESTLVSGGGDAVNVLVVQPDGTRLWRQYRKEADSQEGGYAIKVYEDSAGIPFPPSPAPGGLSSEVLARGATTFNAHIALTSAKNRVESLYFHIKATCGPNTGNQYIMPMKEGVYVLKLSQAQFAALGGMPDGVSVIEPRPHYEPDATPNTYWLCLEDAQAPAVALPTGDWDFNDLMVKVTEREQDVQFEIHWGTAAYVRDIMAPDGTILYPCVGGTHTYTYTPPYGIDTDAVSIDVGLQKGDVKVSASASAMQRRRVF